ncbi:MAG: TVP38/TMEM64 family protein [Leptolyngbya sp. SIO4C5]|nr:TVP38/TMEM64 family protein [Leptolyngbya sp. SIO4C5]
MKQLTATEILRFLVIGLLVGLAIWLVNHYGVAQLRAQVDHLGVWAPLGIFLLRFVSVVIPALPGTAYSVLSGGLLGFSQGLLIICIADMLSCSLSFFLSRRYGRTLVRRLVGDRFMQRIDTLSQRHLERNFFLLTGCLMTGFFDFVCYGVGLTKAPWQRFMPALVISIAISNPPIVALGAGLLEGGKWLLGLSLLGIFGLAIVTGLVQRRQQV